MWIKAPSRNFVLAGVLIGIGVGLAGFLLFGNGLELFKRSKGLQTEAVLAPEVNAPAPDFQLESLDGGSFQLSALDGKPVVLNFWATWCLPCREEMPLLNDFSKNNSAVEVIGINFNESDDTVREFVETYKIDFPILKDPGGEIVKLYRIRGFPSTLFIDRDGVLRYQHVGYLTDDLLKNYIEKLDTQN